VNLSSQSADWIPAGILNRETEETESSPAGDVNAGSDSNDVTSSYPWKISTKYFDADVLLQVVAAQPLFEDSERLQPVIQATEAVVFYCDATKESFQLASLAWERFKEVSPAVCLCVVEQIMDVPAGNSSPRPLVI